MTEWYTQAQGLPLHCRAWTPSTSVAPVADKVIVRFDTAPSRIGPFFVAWHEQWLCILAFAPRTKKTLPVAARFWENAVWMHTPGLAVDTLRRVFAWHEDKRNDAPLSLLLRGSDFQVRVWRALLEVPRGQTISYNTLASRADTPKAARAVGSAMARNPLVYIVPCHRVLRADGLIGQYGGGTALKKYLLDLECLASPPVYIGKSLSTDTSWEFYA